jgi:hypothetical protein
MRRSLLAGLLLAANPAAAAASGNDALVFVVGARSQPIAISSVELRKVYLGKTTRWADGRRIVLAVRPADTAAGKIFFDRVVEVSDIDFSRHWLGVLFRGEAVAAPRVISSADEVRRFLARTPDALAFLLSSELDAGDVSVRPLLVDGRAPGNPSYPYRVHAP